MVRRRQSRRLQCCAQFAASRPANPNTHHPISHSSAASSPKRCNEPIAVLAPPQPLPPLRRSQIPIAPAALPAPYLPPRFRALALFGRRPHARVVRPSLPASENLHRSGPGDRKSTSSLTILRRHLCFFIARSASGGSRHCRWLNCQTEAAQLDGFTDFNPALRRSRAASRSAAIRAHGFRRRGGRPK